MSWKKAEAPFCAWIMHKMELVPIVADLIYQINTGSMKMNLHGGLD